VSTVVGLWPLESRRGAAGVAARAAEEDFCFCAPGGPRRGRGSAQRSGPRGPKRSACAPGDGTHLGSLDPTELPLCCHSADSGQCLGRPKNKKTPP